MIGKFVVAAAVILVIAVMCYLFYDCGVFGNIKKGFGKLSERVKGKNVELADGPVLQIRETPEAAYRKMEVNRRAFKIGSGAGNDLSLSDKTVEEFHAAIYKRLKGNQVYYELINYSKTNPVQYYNKFIKKYEYLGYRDGIDLGSREIFYVGNTKIVITEPVSHVPTDTEYFEMGRPSGKDDEAEPTIAFERIGIE